MEKPIVDASEEVVVEIRTLVRNIFLSTPKSVQYVLVHDVPQLAKPTMSSLAPKHLRLLRFQPTWSCSSARRDLATLKRQMRDSLAHPILRLKSKTSVFAEFHPRTVSRRDAIMKAMEELKAREEMKSLL